MAHSLEGEALGVGYRSQLEEGPVTILRATPERN